MEEFVETPPITDVLSALALQVQDQDQPVDLIEIRRATDYLYMCRVYPAGGGEYEGYMVQLD